MSSDRACWRVAKLAAGGAFPLRVDRLPGRVRGLARRWVAEATDRLELAERYDRLAYMASANSEVKQANEAAETADAIRGGFADAEAARQARLTHAAQEWEAHFGPVGSAEVQERMAAYKRAAAEDEARARAEAARRAAGQSARQNRRRRGRA